MTDIHVPDEVVEAAAKPIYDALEGPINNQDFTRQMRQWQEAKKIALTAIRAALAAWVECGMAKGGVAWKASIRDQHSWLADTDLPNPRGATFPVLILKTTEAP